MRFFFFQVTLSMPRVSICTTQSASKRTYRNEYQVEKNGMKVESSENEFHQEYLKNCKKYATFLRKTLEIV